IRDRNVTGVQTCALPISIRVIIPPTGNEFIAMMKDTAIVSLLGTAAGSAELFRRAQLAFSEDNTKRLEALLTAAGMYWALTAVRSEERRVGKGVGYGWWR